MLTIPSWIHAIGKAFRSMLEPVPVKVIFCPTIRRPQTHWVKVDGVHCWVVEGDAKPPKIVLCGRTDQHWAWENSDYLILERDGRTTRYQIDKLIHRSELGSMYFAECTFAPRGMGL